jgi:hypothetical protein
VRLLSTTLAICCFAALALPGELPANQWVGVEDAEDGGCNGSLFPVPSEKGVLLWGVRPRRDWRGRTLSKKYWIEIFNATERKWTEWVPEAGRVEASLGRHSYFAEWKTVKGYGLPAIPGHNRGYWFWDQGCWLPKEKKLLFFVGGLTFKYDPAKRAFENMKISFGKAPPDVMLGTMVWDPVNSEAVLFGGGYLRAHLARPGDRRQKRPPDAWSTDKWDRRGTWAYNPEKNQWRKLETASKEVGAAWAALRKSREDDLRSLWGACRGAAFEYGEVVHGGKPAELAAIAEKLAAQLAKIAGEMKGKGADEYEKSQFGGAAGALTAGVVPRLKGAAAALKASDGWKAYQAVEAARFKLIEAEETLAPAPRPRHFSRLVLDSDQKKLVLWGGDGEDRWLADTWVFDLAKRRWERCRPKIFPPPSRSGVVAMDYDAKNKIVVLARQGGDVWVFETAKREWRPVDVVRSGSKGFSSWITMAYDRTSGTHVLATMPGKQRRRTFLLRLDLKNAGPGRAKPGTSEEVWRDHYGAGCGGGFVDEYGMAWKLLPKTQAEYRAKVKAHTDRLKAIPVGKWTHIKAPYSGFGRAYGSYCYDWDRDQILLWGGGHSAYMGNEWSQYDIKSNLWMESWNPEYPPGFYGSPDGPGWSPSFRHVKGSGHGYHHYVYCGALKKAVLHGSIYDPDRMRYDGSIRKVGPGSSGIKVAMNGEPALLQISARYYRGAPFGVWKLDPEKKELSRIKGSDTPFGGSDRTKAVFDTRRKRLLFYGAARKNGKKRRYDGFWAYSMKSGRWEEITPKVQPENAARPQIRGWNYCYSSKHDCLLILERDTWIYDCDKNVLKKLDAKIGKGVCGVVYSPKQDLFLTLLGGGYRPQQVWVFRHKP